MKTTSQIPAQCSTALKEWATVLEAMGRGEQVVLIRKGGLIEPGSGFEMAADTFLFYPTFEHQAVNYLRPQFQRYFEDASAKRLSAEASAKAGAPAEQVRFELAGVAAASWRSNDPGVIEQLQDFHIYNDAFATQRLKWQPDISLVIVAIRVFRLPAPQTVPPAPQYAGCKSWVELEGPVELIGARPVLNEETFAERLRKLKAQLGQ